jgi:hypothetical protein
MAQGMNLNKNTAVDLEFFPRRLDIAQVSVYGLAILSAGLFLLFPFVNLFHPSPWQRWMGTLHGVGSLLAMVVMAYAGHLAFPLLRGASNILAQTRTLSFWSAVLSFLAIATGNLAYMRYRADLNLGGARAWLKENSPLSQYILMEYHEFTVLFTLPISIACAWVLWKYGDKILDRQNQPVLAATSIGLMALMFFSMGGMLTGIGIAKIHAL